jgi:hypothetical protein
VRLLHERHPAERNRGERTGRARKLELGRAGNFRAGSQCCDPYFWRFLTIFAKKIAALTIF